MRCLDDPRLGADAHGIDVLLRDVGGRTGKGPFSDSPQASGGAILSSSPPTYPDGPDRAVGHLHGILSTISSEIDVAGGPGLSFRFRSQGYCRRGGGRAILTLVAISGSSHPHDLRGYIRSLFHFRKFVVLV